MCPECGSGAYVEVTTKNGVCYECQDCGASYS